MRAGMFIAAFLAAAWFSGPARADHVHVVHARPYVSLGFGYPYGYGFYRPYGWPWYGPRFGVGVHVDRYPARRSVRTQREQRALTLYVYPAAGQSEQQTADDRYECHVWAVDASGYDPTLGARGREEAESYTRAFSACMEGRDYVVK